MFPYLFQDPAICGVIYWIEAVLLIFCNVSVYECISAMYIFTLVKKSGWRGMPPSFSWRKLAPEWCKSGAPATNVAKSELVLHVI